MPYKEKVTSQGFVVMDSTPNPLPEGSLESRFAGNFILADSLIGGLLAGVTLAQFQQNAPVYAADTGAANAYAITLTPAPTLAPGSQVYFKAANLNTASSTLAVNGGSPITLVKEGSTLLTGGEIVATQIVHAIYDGTNFQVMNPSPTEE